MSKKPAKKPTTKPTTKTATKTIPAKSAPKKAATKPVKKAATAPAKSAKPSKKSPSPKAAAARAAAPSKSRSTTIMRDRAIAHAKFARDTINRYVTGFNDEHHVVQPENVPNHILWTLGHLAATASWLNGLVSGARPVVPDSYNTMFGMDSKPVSDLTVYPPFSEVRKSFDDAFGALIANTAALDDDELLAPPAQDGGGFVTDKLDALFKFAWHEGWHIGQIANLRRGLGITVKGG